MDEKIWHKVFLLSLTILLLKSCTEKEVTKHSEQVESDLSEKINQLENLTIYSPEKQTADTVELVKEQVFESSREVLIKGYISGVVVDQSNRVYIAGFIPGEAGIYVFEPDGSYITTIGRYGRGPGEFESISSMDISNDRLYVFDPQLQRFTVFSLDDFALIKDETINREKVKTSDTLAFTLKGSKLFATSGENFLLGMNKWALNKEDDLAKKFYYKLTGDGILLPEKILELNRFQFFFPETERNSEGNLRMPMPFSPGSVLAISDDDLIYTAWTEDFLVKIYDAGGNYQRAIYYPYSNSKLSIADSRLNEQRLEAIRENPDQVPDSWPALHTIEVDDENRLWVSTITDSDSTFRWWVLDQKGKLLARFDWPGERWLQTPMTSPMLEIKNGYLYTSERDISARRDQIIKYKIYFKKR